MKKIKIMLLAIGLMAVTGGLLAFKTMYDNHYCITPATNLGGYFSCANYFGVPLTCDYLISGIQTMAAEYFDWDVYCYRQAIPIESGGIETYSCYYYGLELPCETMPIITFPIE